MTIFFYISEKNGRCTRGGISRDLRSKELNKTLAALLRHDLIAMKRDPQDLRFNSIELSERGRQLISAIDLDLRGLSAPEAAAPAVVRRLFRLVS